MIDADRLHCQIWAMQPAYQDALARAHAVIADALATPTSGPWYLSLSGGIDSTVLLDLVWQHQPGIAVLWGDDGYDFPETLAFLADTERRYGFHLIRVRSLAPWASWCIEMGRPDLAYDPAARDAWVNPLVWDHEWHTLTRDASRRGGYGGVFLGMLGTARKRGGESHVRQQVLRNGYRPTYRTAIADLVHCSPLASWTKQLVWAYAVANNLAYNPVYDRLGTLGVPLKRRRTSALTCFRILTYGSHAVLHQGWPALYAQLVANFPEVGGYV